jgi:hypothetical protein
MLVLVTDNLWVANKFVEKAAEPLNPSPRHDFHLERQLPSAFLLDDGKPACSEFEVGFEEIAMISAKPVSGPIGLTASEGVCLNAITSGQADHP